jgi:hypothetical protein
MMQLIWESGPSSSRLGKILDANVRPDYRSVPQLGLTTLGSQIDPAADLLDEVAVTRGLNDMSSIPIRDC